jgi:PAS domain-containing protein
MGMAIDVTKTKEAENSLRESENKYKSLFNNMQSAAAYHQIVLNKKGKAIDYIFLDANPKFEEMTTLKSKKILGKRVTKVIPGIEKSDFDWIGTYGKVATSGKPISRDRLWRGRGGHVSVPTIPV